MNKAGLIDALSEQTGLDKKDCKKMLETTMDIIENQLAAGERVQLAGFGCFEVQNRHSREGVNPRTKERMMIPACKCPSFKAGKVLKGAVNEE